MENIITQALTRFSSVLTPLLFFIFNQPILLTCVVGGLFVIGAKVFKRIKNSVK